MHKTWQKYTIQFNSTQGTSKWVKPRQANHFGQWCIPIINDELQNICSAQLEMCDAADSALAQSGRANSLGGAHLS